ncbi:inner membrane protein YiaA [Tenacibaculum discolor]|uniref:inner membrane protein YiaA n=1 Tax=Tenacibaculum discolor TaxID=361581 RepID=UPI000EB1A5EA|nr:inner membrane protein YiaA [Tenacibaculum discolor]RLK02295.1 putative membrane protein YiaA [Tenacibaculum discolor]
MNNQSEWSLDQNKKTKKEKKKILKVYNQKPTSAYIGASWVALLIGISSYCIGLWNVEMELNEKGYYFTVLLFALFSVISVQKSVRDRLEGIKVTEIYYSISWFTTVASIVLLVVGLWNANLLLSEKGFYAMSFSLSVYAAISVQKNTRDLEYINKIEEKEGSE